MCLAREATVTLSNIDTPLLASSFVNAQRARKDRAKQAAKQAERKALEEKQRKQFQNIDASVSAI